MKGIFRKSCDDVGYYFMLEDPTKTFRDTNSGWTCPQIHLKSDIWQEAIKDLGDKITSGNYEVVDDMYYETL